MVNEMSNAYEYTSQGKVFYVKEYALNSKKLNAPDVVYEEMKDIASADQETLWVLGVNTQNMITSKNLVSLGGISSTIVDTKILFRRLIMHNASSFIVVHNHPSGVPYPSDEDKNLTERLKKCADILQIKFLDHIIIGDNCYYSFASEVGI